MYFLYKIHIISFLTCGWVVGVANGGLFRFTREPFLHHVVINNPFFIVYNHSFKKGIVFVAFKLKIADGNAVHSFFPVKL